MERVYIKDSTSAEQQQQQLYVPCLSTQEAFRYSSQCRSQKHIHRTDLRVPGAFRYRVLEVGTCESRARHKVDVLLGVEAHFL